MKYREMLSFLIRNSGKNLKEIAEQCQLHGVSIDASYISKLQTGKKPPASDKLNRVLSEVLGGNLDELIVAAYREKIPANVLKRLATGQKANSIPPTMMLVAGD